MTPDLPIVMALAATAFLAGGVDAIAGGGGLLTVPAMLLAGIDAKAVIATNKLQGTFGSGSATAAFYRGGHLDARAGAGFAIAAALGSVAGALLLDRVPTHAVTDGLPFLLLALALYFALSPKLGDADRHRRLSPETFALTAAPLVGLYDGLFGPGAGSFYMVGFVALLGYGVVRATANTKLANFASNLAGLATFALSGHVIWGLGLAMAGGQVLGAQVGARLAIRHGARIVRPLLVTISLVLALRLALQPGHPVHDAIFR